MVIRDGQGSLIRFLDNYGSGGYDYYTDSYEDADEFNVKNTLRFMFDHDRHEWKPVLIEYGKRWKRKLKLV